MKIKQPKALEFRRRKPVHSADLLMPQSPEKGNFQPEKDILPEVKAELFNALDRLEEVRKWDDYADLFVKLQALFPDMEGRTKCPFPLNEARRLVKDIFQDRLDSILNVAQKFAGVGIDYKQLVTDGQVNRYLQISIDQSLAHFNDLTVFFRGVTVLQLRLRPVEEIFKDRELAWKKLTQEITQAKSLDDWSIYANLLSHARILFPERFSELDWSASEVRRMKEELRSIDGMAFSKIVDYALAIQHLLADELRLDKWGNIQAISHPPVERPVPLPQRSEI